jgi:hypothetical protein
MKNKNLMMKIARAAAELDHIEGAVRRVRMMLINFDGDEQDGDDGEEDEDFCDHCDNSKNNADDEDGDDALFPDVDHLTSLLHRELGIPSPIIGTVLVYANDIVGKAGRDMRSDELVHAVSAKTGAANCVVCEILQKALGMTE